MGNLFGIRRRAPVVTEQDRAILQLKQSRDKIKIYQKRAEAELEKSKEFALNLFQKNMKERALVVLRRKKFLEDIINRTDKQLETLEQLVVDIEYNQIQVSVVEGLKVGADALKQLNNMFAIGDIQQIMDDTEEAAEKQQEISDILQQSSERYDEQDLLEELKSYQTPAAKQVDQELVTDTTPSKSAEEKPTEDLVEDDSIEEVTHSEPEPGLNLDTLPDIPEEIPDRPDKKPDKIRRQLEPAQ